MILPVLIGLTVLGGCTQNRQNQNALLTEENRGLREQIVERDAQLQVVQGELRDEKARSDELKRMLDDARAMARVAPPVTSPAPVQAMAPAEVDPFRGIAGVSGSVGAGEVTATVQSDVLFSAGKATLRSSAKQSLQAVARVLRDEYRGKVIRVAGHTDPDPIRKSGFKSNYHLGFERAYAVREYLISQGVPARKLYIASHGPDRATGSKKESRRVEIAVVLNET